MWNRFLKGWRVSGWIKLWRQIENHRHWNKKRSFSDFEAWIWILMEAAFEPEERNGVNLKRGEFVATYEELATRWRWSVSSVGRFMREAIQKKEIESSLILNWQVFRVVNYEKYQGLKLPPKPKLNANGTLADIPLDNKDLKNLRIKNFPPTPLPENLDTPEFLEAIAEWLEHKTQRGETYTAIGLKQCLSRISKWGPERAIAAIHFSCAQNYQGIFEEGVRGGSTPRLSSQERKREQDFQTMADFAAGKTPLLLGGK